MSKISWPPHGYEPPKEETRASVFNELLKTYIRKRPSSMATGATLKAELAEWRKRYRDALTD